MSIKVCVLFAVFCVSSAVVRQSDDWNFARFDQQTAKMESSFSRCILDRLIVGDVTYPNNMITKCAQMSKYAAWFPFAYVETLRKEKIFDATCLKDVLTEHAFKKPQHMVHPDWTRNEVCKFFETKILPAYCGASKKCSDNPVVGASLVRQYAYASIVVMSNEQENDTQTYNNVSSKTSNIDEIGFRCPTFNLHFNPKLLEYGTKIGPDFKWLTRHLNCSKFD
ncbi:hypothetical protein M3Y97_01086600 [Aphelenchoides bicaudatus]|nr:hypothetical protein M3Y97_01086600 [Aphelenchoides bicaudatus]